MGEPKKKQRTSGTGKDLRLHLHILLQSLEDVLNYELGFSLQGLNDASAEDREEAYESALIYLGQFPALVKRLQTREKSQWLKEIQEVSDDLS